MKRKTEDNELERLRSLPLKIACFYKKYKLWIYIAAGGVFILCWYLHGAIETIFAALGIVLGIIFIKAFWEIAKWLMNAKSEHVQQKRTLGILITALGLASVYFAVKYLVLPTQLGQSLQEFLYKMF